MTDPRTSIERSYRAASAMEEFFIPAFDAVDGAWRDAAMKIMATEPWAVDKARAMAVAVRYAAEVRSILEAIIMDGEVAKATQSRIDRLSLIPTEKRKLLGI